MNLQYIKNTFHVAHFHITEFLSTRNMFKEVHVIKSRGALRTGFTNARVWQRAVNRQPGSRSKNLNFSKQLRPYRTFTWHYHFNISLDPSKCSTHLFQKQCLYGQNYLRARPHSGSLTYCFLKFSKI